MSKQASTGPLIAPAWSLGFAIWIWSAGSATLYAGDAACEPRSTTDPGRLNIAIEADGHGMIPPCRAEMELYIARNTPLRSLEQTIRTRTADGGVERMDRHRVELERTDYGMYASQIALARDADVACRNVSVAVDIRACMGEGDAPIECPGIRVKAPRTMTELSVTGDGVSVCDDD